MHANSQIVSCKDGKPQLSGGSFRLICKAVKHLLGANSQFPAGQMKNPSSAWEATLVDSHPFSNMSPTDTSLLLTEGSSQLAVCSLPCRANLHLKIEGNPTQSSWTFQPFQYAALQLCFTLTSSKLQQFWGGEGCLPCCVLKMQNWPSLGANSQISAGQMRNPSSVKETTAGCRTGFACSLQTSQF